MTHRDRIKSLLAGFVLALLLLGACDLRRPPPVPGGSGGWFATGGTVATGGASIDVGGAAAGQPGAETGGAVATGGAPVAVEWPECDPPSQKAAPVVRHPLGRHRAAVTRKTRASYTIVEGLSDVGWLPLLDSLDQKELGACTGFAALQCRLSAPWAWGGPVEIEPLNQLARTIYSGATKRDPWPGTWPPTDTGSNGVSALDEAISRGIFGGYRTIETFEELQYAIQNGPCIIGTDWPEGFFAPDRCGRVKPTGAVVGGHEWVIHGLRYDTKEGLGRTSWGRFGRPWRNKWGFFWVTFGTIQNLLNSGGDIQCPRLPQ